MGEMFFRENISGSHFGVTGALLAAGFVVLSLGVGSAPAAAQGKTYVVTNSEGNHWTQAGRAFRKAKYSGKRYKLVRLEPGDGFVLANKKRAWGTRLAVYQLSRIMAMYQQRFPKEMPVIVRDMSKKGGGLLSGHNSHIDGRDVDIPLILNKVGKITSETVRTVDAEKTWFLVQTLVNTCDTEFIFVDRKIQKILIDHAVTSGYPAKMLDLIFQYPSKKMKGLVLHWPKHKDHLHVRFRKEKAPMPLPTAEYCKALKGTP